MSIEDVQDATKISKKTKCGIRNSNNSNLEIKGFVGLIIS